MKIKTFLFTLIVAVLIGAVYGFTTLMNEYFYLDAALAFVAGTFIARFLKYMSRKEGAYNIEAVRIQSLCFAVLALLVSWAMWIYVALETGYFLSFGNYVLDSGTVAGIPIGQGIYVFWFIEAAIFLGFSLRMNDDNNDSVLFCTQCMSRKRKKKNLIFKAHDNLFEFTKSIEESDFSVLAELEKWQGRGDRLDIKVSRCGTCTSHYLIDISMGYPIVEARKINEKTYLEVLEYSLR